MLAQVFIYFPNIPSCMELTLVLNKTVEQNAEECFLKAKKFKKKLEGVRTTIAKFKAELQEIEKNKDKFEKEFEEKREKPVVSLEPKKWYHSFRWFISSEGFLCVGGRDAGTNEIMIKRYTEKEDIIFHTEMPGSPFFVIKTKGEKIGEKLTEVTLNEVAIATASYSKAWKQGLSIADVYWINSEQVNKEAKSGEYLSKGAFVVTGKRNYFRVALKIAIGIIETGEVMGGPIEAVKSLCKKYFIVEQGKDKPSDAGKKIMKHLGGNLDDIIRVIPAGECKVTLVESESH